MPGALTLLPPPIWRFLGSKNTFPAHRFFLSFEDALWSIVSSLDLNGKTVLYPSFFCMDVVNRLDMRGAICIPYKVTRDLLPDTESLFKEMAQYSPSIVILYHPLGLRLAESLISEVIDRGKREAIVIEDCADLFISTDEIELKSDNHVIIDSLRKVTPIQGARVFCSNKFNLKGSNISHYSLLALLYYLTYRLLHLVGVALNSRKILDLCWSVFNKHSDLIGASSSPNLGFLWDKYLANYVASDLIRKSKSEVCSIYVEEVNKRVALTPFCIRLPEVSFDSLRFFPLVFQKGVGDKISSLLERQLIFVDTHFNDSPHCEQLDYLLLPLWHTMTKDDVAFILDRVEEAVKQVQR